MKICLFKKQNKTKQNGLEKNFFGGSRTPDFRRERVTRDLLRHDN